MSLIGSRDLDGIGQLFDAGKELALGLVPSVEPEKPVTWKECAMPAVTLVDRLGFSRELLQTQVAVTPRCGLSGANLDWARAALRLCTDVGKALVTIRRRSSVCVQMWSRVVCRCEPIIF